LPINLCKRTSFSGLRSEQFFRCCQRYGCSDSNMIRKSLPRPFAPHPQHLARIENRCASTPRWALTPGQGASAQACRACVSVLITACRTYPAPYRLVALMVQHKEPLMILPRNYPHALFLWHRYSAPRRKKYPKPNPACKFVPECHQAGNQPFNTDIGMGMIYLLELYFFNHFFLRVPARIFFCRCLINLPASLWA